MLTFFARHTESLDVDDPTRAKLWDEQRIAIHYPHFNNEHPGKEDVTSLISSDYQDVGSRRAINAIVELKTAGGYVCAQYCGMPNLLLGYVPPDSKVELIKGKWGTRNEFEGRTAILKSLPLTKVRIVKPVDHAVLIVGRPRQGTLTRWHLAGDTIINLVERRRVVPTLTHLSASQQEIMCSEFLREPSAYHFDLPILRQLLLPTGGTMKDLDIVGIAQDGKRIMAQVTYSSKGSGTVDWKIERLLDYADDSSHLLLFCDCDQQHVDAGVTFVPLNQVFEAFSNTPAGAKWLKLSV